MDASVQFNLEERDEVNALDAARDRLLNPPQTERRNSRRPSFCKTEISWDSKSVLDLTTGLPPGGPRLVNEPTWKPSESDASLKEKKPNKNILDMKSLYSIRGVNLAGRDLQFVNQCPSVYNDPTTTNVQHLVEKNYINSSRLANATPEKFPKVILRRFHRVSHTDVFSSYGMPRPPSRDKFNTVIDTLKREPSILNVDNYPMLQEPVNCSSADEYCEVLGPSSCQGCIEHTNRRIGEELQHMSFPTIEMTTNKLIQPKLARIFKDGHKVQVKRNRLRELGLEFSPELFMSMRRKETALTSSTCMNCRKPILAGSTAAPGTASPKKIRVKVKKAKTARV